MVPWKDLKLRIEWSDSIRDDSPVSIFKWPAPFNSDIPISFVRGTLDFRRMDYDLAIWFNLDFARMATQVYEESVGNLPLGTDIVLPGLRNCLSQPDGMEWFRKIASRPPDSEFDCANHLEQVLSRILKYNSGTNMYMLYDHECGVWQSEKMSWGATIGSSIDLIINNFGLALFRAARLLNTLGELAAPDPGPKPSDNVSVWNVANNKHKEMLKIVEEVEKTASAIFNGKYKEINAAFKRRLEAPQTAWDSDMRWIILTDGVINVDEVHETGNVSLYEFSPEHMSTMALEVGLMDSYRNAGVSEWDRGISKVLPDADVRRYLQKRFGAALLGKPGKAGKSMVWQHGIGDTAKSTIQECIAGSEGVFAPYSHISSARALTKTGEKMGVTALFKAYARGKRFAIMDELDDGETLAQAELKSMTGGGSVEGTAKYANSVSYYFTASLFMASNHPPTFPPGDTAALGRIHVVPFTHKLFIKSKDPEGWEAADDFHRADEQWASRVLESKQERASILRWVIDGLIFFGQDGGIGNLPEAMIEAAQEFSADSDPVSKIIRAMLGEEPGYDATPMVRIYTDAEWDAYRYSEKDDSLTQLGVEQLIEVLAQQLRVVKQGEPVPQRWMRAAKKMLDERGGKKKKVRMNGTATEYRYSRARLEYAPLNLEF